MPSLLTALILCLFPESPRFLLIKGEEEEAHTVLSEMYAINTNRHPADYPVMCIEGDPDDGFNNNSVRSIMRVQSFQDFSVRVNEAWMQNRSLFGRHYIKYLFLTCFADFGLMSR